MGKVISLDVYSLPAIALVEYELPIGTTLLEVTVCESTTEPSTRIETSSPCK